MLLLLLRISDLYFVNYQKIETIKKNFTQSEACMIDIAAVIDSPNLVDI